MGVELVGELQEEMARGEVVVLVGAGVAVGAAGGKPEAGWEGLMLSGIARAEAVNGTLPPSFGEVLREQLVWGTLEGLLGVAEQVTSALGGREGGEFKRWLRESVGFLAPGGPVGAGRAVGVESSIADDQDDGLLEEASGFAWLTWRDPSRVQRVLRGDAQAVVHLHGFWDDPASVVFGVRAYEALLGSAGAQGLQRALGATKSFCSWG